MRGLDFGGGPAVTAELLVLLGRGSVFGMQTSWIVNLRVAFEGSAALVGHGRIARGVTTGPIMISGVPLGDEGWFRFDEFIRAAAESGVQRLFLQCAEGVRENLDGGWGRYRGDEFVLVGEPVGTWQLQHLLRGDRWAFAPSDPPTGPQLDVAEATNRLEGLLLACLEHPDPGYRDDVRRGLAVLAGRSLPKAGFVQPYGVSEAAVRLYIAAMQITKVALTGMGGFADRAPVSSFDVVYTVAQAVAASTRDPQPRPTAASRSPELEQ